MQVGFTQGVYMIYFEIWLEYLKWCGFKEKRRAVSYKVSPTDLQKPIPYNTSPYKLNRVWLRMHFSFPCVLSGACAVLLHYQRLFFAPSGNLKKKKEKKNCPNWHRLLQHACRAVVFAPICTGNVNLWKTTSGRMQIQSSTEKQSSRFKRKKKISVTHL